MPLYLRREVVVWKGYHGSVGVDDRAFEKERTCGRDGSFPRPEVLEQLVVLAA